MVISLSVPVICWEICSILKLVCASVAGMSAKIIPIKDTTKSKNRLDLALINFDKNNLSINNYMLFL